MTEYEKKSVQSSLTTVTEILGTRRISAKFIPRFLTLKKKKKKERERERERGTD
jgi:hypothetical protein